MNQPKLVSILSRKLLGGRSGGGSWMGPALLSTSLIAVSIVAVGACQEVAVLRERTLRLEDAQADVDRLARSNDMLQAIAARCERSPELAQTLPPPSLGTTVGDGEAAHPPLPPIQRADRPEPETQTQRQLEPEPNPVQVPNARCQGAGAITRPVNDSLVDRVFETQVTYKGSGKYLWLAVYHSGRYWPKEPRIEPTRTGEWIGDIAEDGYPPGLKFELVLLDVSAEHHAKFEAWFERGHRIHSYPGFDASALGSEDVCVVDSKKLHLVGSSKR